MKNMYFFPVLILAVFLTGACASKPEPPAPAPTPTVQPATPSPTPTPTPSRSQVIILDGAQSYTITKNDTLSGISEQFYGNSLSFPIIMLGSTGVINDPDVIEPGDKLTIPNLQRNLNDASAKARIKSFTDEIALIYEKRSRPAYAQELRNHANSF